MGFDVALIHAPSVYDFRKRDDILFAYLSNSDSVHVSSIFEMPPVGILAIKQHLQRCGYSVEFFNIASRMLRDPDFDVEDFFNQLECEYLGVDLHWLPHAHGALELTRIYKHLHPETKTFVGGISSTFYHEELIRYPQIDYVLRGFDTLRPVELLMDAGDSPDNLKKVPNLTWKDRKEIQINELSYVPDSYSAQVDWAEVFHAGRRDMTPYNIVIPQSGCEYDCRWCGGSKYFYYKYMGKVRNPVHKKAEVLEAELRSIVNSDTRGHTITMIDFFHEYPELLDVATNVFFDEKIKSVHFSLTRIPSVETGKQMALPANAVIELSPDSHDLKVARASGRGHYTMEEMELFIDTHIDEMHSFEIYFMLGLSEQTVESIWGTVDYCEHLLHKYRGKRVLPFICPMLPFLDPGSVIFDQPERYGYTLYYRTLEEHRQALLSMNWKHRLNYDTQWISRDALVDISYESVRALTRLKAKYGLLPSGIARRVLEIIDDTRSLLKDIDDYQGMPDDEARKQVERKLKKRIFEYNKEQFRRVRSQQRPVDLGFAKQQWFDTDEAFDAVLAGRTA